TSLASSFTEKADLRTIFKAYATDAEGLMTNGIPADQLVAPWVQQVFGDAEGASIPFGPAPIADYNAVKSYPSLAPIAEQIDKLPSLQGDGPVDWGSLSSDLYTLLVRGAGEKFKVATL